MKATKAPTIFLEDCPQCDKHVPHEDGVPPCIQEPTELRLREVDSLIGSQKFRPRHCRNLRAAFDGQCTKRRRFNCAYVGVRVVVRSAHQSDLPARDFAPHPKHVGSAPHRSPAAARTTLSVNTYTPPNSPSPSSTPVSIASIVPIDIPMNSLSDSARYANSTPSTARQSSSFTVTSNGIPATLCM